MVHAENGHLVYEGQKRMIESGGSRSNGKNYTFSKICERTSLCGSCNEHDALEEVAKARQLVIGQPIIAAMVLNDSSYWNPDFNIAARAVMSPPMMPEGHNKALQAALSKGVLQLVGTDHCRFNSTQKALGINDFRRIPGGVNGIGERMHLVWDTMVESFHSQLYYFKIYFSYTTNFTVFFSFSFLVQEFGKNFVTDYVRITSTESAKIFNIYPRKGAIRIGSDTDIIVLNPNASFEISAESDHSKSDMNVFEGMSGMGKVEVTISKGRIVWQNDELTVVPGAGRRVGMRPFGYLFNGIDKSDVPCRSSLKAPVDQDTPKI